MTKIDRDIKKEAGQDLQDSEHVYDQAMSNVGKIFVLLALQMLLTVVAEAICVTKVLLTVVY